MVEAVANVRAIANAHQLYYLTHGEYLGPSDMDKLDITIPGTIDNSFGSDRIKTNDFIYAPSDSEGIRLAVAQRVRSSSDASRAVYFIHITQTNPEKINCNVHLNGSANSIQKELCQQLNRTGVL